MTGVIQLFTRQRDDAEAAGQPRASKADRSRRRAAAAGVAGKAGAFDYSGDVAAVSTDNEAPNNHFDNTTLSGIARRGARPRRDGCASSDAGSSARPARRGRRRSGVPTWTPSTSATIKSGACRSTRRPARCTSAPRMAPRSRTRRRPISSRIRRTRRRSADSSAPFEFSDFTYDSRTDLTRHHASYQLDGTIATAHAGTHVETALVDWDGERATLRDALAGTSHAGVARQRRPLAAAPGAVVDGVRHRRRAVRAQRELRQRDGAARRGRVVRAHRRRRARRDAAARDRGTRHQGADHPPDVQHQPVLPGQSRSRSPSRSRAFDLGVEQRFARDRARVDVTWFDNRYRNIIGLRDGRPRGVHLAVLQHRPDRARAAPS